MIACYDYDAASTADEKEHWIETQERKTLYDSTECQDRAHPVGFYHEFSYYWYDQPGANITCPYRSQSYDTWYNQTL